MCSPGIININLLYQVLRQNYTLNVTEAFWKTFTRTHTLQNTFRFGSSKIDVDLSTTYAEAK